jgi:hypothetical protein
MMIGPAAATAHRSARRTRGRGASLPVVAVAGGLVLLAFAYVGYVLWPRPLSPLSPTDAPSIPITVAGLAFNVPTAAVRIPLQRRAGGHERVDLVFLWPSLVPPNGADTRPVLAEPPLHDRIFVTIAASDGSLAPVERLTAIYPRYLAGEAAWEPEGLMRVPFRPESPYRGEDLVYAPTLPIRFIARCSRAAAVPDTCLLQRRIDSVDITLRFPRDWLVDWQNLARGIDSLIASLRPPSR